MANVERTSSSGSGSGPDYEKSEAHKIEQIKTMERVPGHDNYYEKDGLRTYGDGQDHDHEPPMTTKRILALVAMAFNWTGSQIPVYLFGGIPPLIYRDIGGADRWIWFILGNLLALAGVCPFVGSLSDLFGRRYVSLAGSTLIVIGMIVCSTAHAFNNFIAGMVLAGAGAGICELTALAVTSELAPTRKRGKYVAILIFTIVPFCPSVLWAQLIVAHSSWRYVGLLCGVWNFIGLVMTAIFYHPPPRPNTAGRTRGQILKEVDWLGGFLSISGMILFMAGMQWGGYQYSWKSAHTLVPLILGFVLLVAFVVWQNYAPHPMFPRRLRQHKRILGMTLIITFISGANFFSVLMFWPTQSFNMYNHDPVSVGLKGLPIGFSILAGACIVLVLMSALRGRIRELLVVSSILMTAGCGSLAIARTDNMNQVWGLLVLAGLGIGGIVVPASIVSTIVSPDDLIATMAALTLAIRVIGGSVAYCIYYNVFLSKFIPAATHNIGFPMILDYKIYDVATITEVIQLTGASLLDEIKLIPAIAAHPGAWEVIVEAGKQSFAEAYKYVYYVSIAFGVISIICSALMGDISPFMDDHVAVDYH